MAEGESVVGGVLFEEGGEVGAFDRMGVDDEEACDEGRDGAEGEEDDGDALAGSGEWVGDGEGFGFVGFVVEPGGDEKDEGWEGGEDVVLLAGGEREEEERDCGPETEEEAGALGWGEGADGDEGAEGFAPGDGAKGAEEVGAPGHEPDEEESPEEIEGDGVVVARDAEVEVAEEVLVDEVEPEPAVDVAVGG